jgi:hypothetical protein
MRERIPMRLMVKRYQPAIARDTLICLDLFQADYGRRQRHTATELAIVTAASLANHVIVREGLPMGLLTVARDPLVNASSHDVRLPQPVAREQPDRSQGLRLTPELASAWGPSAGRTVSARQQTSHSPSSTLPASGVVRFSLPPRTGRGQLMSVLEILARVQSVPEAAKIVRRGVAAMPVVSVGPTASVGSRSLGDLVRHAATSLSWGATITIITGRETQELLDALFHLRRAGYAIAVILVQPGVPAGDLRERSERLRVPIYRVWQETDLESTIGAAGGRTPTSAAHRSGSMHLRGAPGQPR